jgi:hypothetical protein
MHRMRHPIALAFLASTLAAALTSRARAELIRPSADRVYPDIAADINGVQDYDYDPNTRTGLFQVTNTPFLLTMGSSLSDEVNVQPNSDGVRRQTVQLKLDANGNLIDAPENSYRLYGTVVVGGEKFDGLLREGTPRSFGAKAARDAGIDQASVYDLDVKITGGYLAERFGPDAYMRISPEVANTFDGSFSKSFAGVKAQSNTRAYHAPASPVPEPTPLVLLLACGAGLVYRRRRRVRREDLVRSK